MRGPGVLIFGCDDRDDDVAGCHTDSTADENWLSAKFVHVGDCWKGGQPHRYADYASCEKRDAVRGEAEAVEDLRSVVEDGVDP